VGEGFCSRGFRGRRRSRDETLPPGQYLVDGFPVLSAGPTPRTPLGEWDFSILGEVDEPRRWTWEEFKGLPSEEITKDIHCVTKWSKLGTKWEGVSVDTLLDGVETAAEYVTAFCDGDYTTNVPLEALREARRGWPTPTTGSHWSPFTADRRACWCRTCTSGRAPSGSGVCNSPPTTSPASGSLWATTTTETPG
jgi:Oxidoreductase molybdopterin binding domain